MTKAVIETQVRVLVMGQQEAQVGIAGSRPDLRGTRVPTVIERRAGEQGECMKNACVQSDAVLHPKAHQGQADTMRCKEGQQMRSADPLVKSCCPDWAVLSELNGYARWKPWRPSQGRVGS
jgi:hypothetical protein